MAARPDGYKFEFTMDNVQNAGSVKESGGFMGMRILTNENFLVAEVTDPDNTGVRKLTNTIPATILEIDLFQDSYTAWSENIDVDNTDEVSHNNYTIQFKPINALPERGSIKLQYPAQIQI